MVPAARQDGLLIQEIGSELVVYDQTRDQAHTLNRTAAFIWRNCDGETSVAQLAALVAVELNVAADEDVVWMALERLSRADLLRARVQRPGRAVSRRELLRRMGVVGAAAVILPVVSSLAAPTPAMAASGPAACVGQPDGAPCTDTAQCCSPLVCVPEDPADPTGPRICAIDF